MQHHTEPTPETEPSSTRLTSLWMGRILVAEDNDGMLRLLRRHLRAGGHDVVEAKNGLELMQWIDAMARSADPELLCDLIVTDLRLPAYSGQQCLDELRQRGLGTPVIMITAFGNKAVHEAALASGARAVFDKPLDFEDLLTAVRALL
jgi:CheY-like chemotaxis protein